MFIIKNNTDSTSPLKFNDDGTRIYPYNNQIWIKRFPWIVEYNLDYLKIVDLSTLVKWCLTNFGENGKKWEWDSYKFYFNKVDDAMQFYLTWNIENDFS